MKSGYWCFKTHANNVQKGIDYFSHAHAFPDYFKKFLPVPVYKKPVQIEIKSNTPIIKNTKLINIKRDNLNVTPSPVLPKKKVSFKNVNTRFGKDDAEEAENDDDKVSWDLLPL